MPRKQNGWGASGKNQGFKGINNRTDVGKKRGAAGLYPSDRSFGSVVQRTVIEQFNIDSDWSRWRKGLEFYYQMAWYRLKQFDTDPSSPTFDEYVDVSYDALLYQGTNQQYNVNFEGYKFATQNSDTNAHYVLKRTPINPPSLGTVTAVQADNRVYTTNFQNKEIWVQLSQTANTPLLTSMGGDRVTDGVTEATVKRVLTADAHPAVYKGNSLETKVFVQVPVAELNANPFVQANNNQIFSLVGKIGYLPSLYTRRAIGSEAFVDKGSEFCVVVDSTEAPQAFQILDQNELPTTLYDINNLTPLFSTTNAEPKVTSTFNFNKAEYQPLFGSQYLTADVVKAEATEMSFAILPFEIRSVIDQGDGTALIEAEVFPNELNVYADATNGFMVFTDFSFTKLVRDEYDGSYYHLQAPTDDDWMRIETDVDPWMDEIFTSGNPLIPATLYTCSCPSYSSAQLAMPEATQDAGERANNRQRRYPLPTAKGKAATAGDKTAGKMQSWENERRRTSFKQCKHTIAAKFIERIKTQEPKSYPSSEAREAFEEKLKGEIQTVGAEFSQSYRRGEIGIDELIFAMAQGLNLDEIELAYALLNGQIQ